MAVEESLMRVHVVSYFGRRSLGSITQTDVQGFVSDLEAKGLASSTIRQAYLLVAGVFSSAVESGVLGRSPCRGIKMPRDRNDEPRYLSAGEVAELVSKVDGRYQTMVLAAAYTGMRFGELAGLRVRDLDLLKARVTVRKTLSEVRGVVSLTDPKTAASKRQIALPAFLVERIALHLAEYPAGPDGYVFASPEGLPIRRTNFRRRVWIPAVVASVGLPLRFHDLRHTHAAMLIAQGEHPKTIQTRLGHASISTTLDIYGHLMEGLDAAAADRLDGQYTAARAAQVRPTASGEVVDLPGRSGKNPR